MGQKTAVASQDEARSKWAGTRLPNQGSRSNIPTIWASSALTILAFSYLTWQLLGIRHADHDDIYFHLFAWMSSGDYLGFAANVAHIQARVQAFINMPLILWANKLSDSAWYDAVNLGSFALVYVSLILFLKRLGSLTSALTLASATLLLFPLHYFYTFPQCYPLIYSWSLAAGLLAPALLDAYLDRPTGLKLWSSVILFLCSLWGPEYNFVLHPVLLVLIVIHRRIRSFRAAWTLAWPYVMGSIMTLGFYLAYSLSTRAVGGNSDNRVSVGLHPLRWLETMLTLQGKAFLPSALAIGLDLPSAPMQGSPRVDSPFTYESLWHSAHDRLSLMVVFLAASWAFFVLLKRQTTTPRACGYYAAVSLLIAAIPAGIVSLSALYQMNVLKGYLQGHLVTFYSQFGLSGALFSLCMFAYNAAHGRFRSGIQAASIVLLASAATLTFVYNNINRQLMMANGQKWAAMNELIDFAYAPGSDLIGKTIVAPAFWTSSGVSQIPTTHTLQQSVNYWTAYCRYVMGSPLTIEHIDKQIRNADIIAGYAAIPSGSPLVFVAKRSLQGQGWQVTLIAKHPLAGQFGDASVPGAMRGVEPENWKCGQRCVNTLQEGVSFHPERATFVAENHGPRRLLAQFVLPRGGRYAAP